VDEAAQLTIGDITRGSSPAVRLLGKGNKTRSCPIWKRTADVLRPLASGRAATDFVFLNHRDEPLTRFGIYTIVRRAASQAARTLPTLAAKRISPHITVFDIRAQSTCFAPAWTSIQSGLGLDMCPWTLRTFTRRLTWR
jgi:site-specific recombinase XerD